MPRANARGWPWSEVWRSRRRSPGGWPHPLRRPVASALDRPALRFGLFSNGKRCDVELESIHDGSSCGRIVGRRPALCLPRQRSLVAEAAHTALGRKCRKCCCAAAASADPMAARGLPPDTAYASCYAAVPAMPFPQGVAIERGNLKCTSQCLGVTGRAQHRDDIASTPVIGPVGSIPNQL